MQNDERPLQLFTVHQFFFDVAAVCDRRLLAVQKPDGLRPPLPFQPNTCGEFSRHLRLPL